MYVKSSQNVTQTKSSIRVGLGFCTTSVIACFYPSIYTWAWTNVSQPNCIECIAT